MKKLKFCSSLGFPLQIVQTETVQDFHRSPKCRFLLDGTQLWRFAKWLFRAEFRFM